MVARAYWFVKHGKNSYADLNTNVFHCALHSPEQCIMSRHNLVPVLHSECNVAVLLSFWILFKSNI